MSGQKNYLLKGSVGIALLVIFGFGYHLFKTTIAPIIAAKPKIESSYEKELDPNMVTGSDFTPKAAVIEKLQGDVGSVMEAFEAQNRVLEEYKKELQEVQQQNQDLQKQVENPRPIASSAEEWLENVKTDADSQPNENPSKVYVQDKEERSVTESVSEALKGDPLDLITRIADFKKNREQARPNYQENLDEIDANYVQEKFFGLTKKKMHGVQSQNDVDSGRPVGLASSKDLALETEPAIDISDVTNSHDRGELLLAEVEWKTYEPTDAVVVIAEEGKTQITYPELVGKKAQSRSPVHTANVDRDGTATSRNTETEPEPIPFATLNLGAKIVGARAIDGLIGIVPVNGAIASPNRFSIKVGPRVLATNGLMIHGLAGMEFYGIAQGNFSDSCVRGYIDSMTYIFEDGTIHSITSETASGISVNDEFLGRLVDDEGYECIQGTVSSDIPENLTARALAGGIEGYSRAFADSQTQQFGSIDSGTTTKIVNGDRFTYAGAEAMAEAAASGSELVDQIYGAPQITVWVPNNTLVGVRITRELELDYKPNARKINYAYGYNDTNQTYYTELD